MILGPPLIVTCPECAAQFSRFNMVSGNTFGAIFWSDGFFLAPMMPDIPRFTKCRNCGTIFNLHTCESKESEDSSTDHLPMVESPDTGTLTEAIDLKVFGNSSDDEKYLRVRLWWSKNQRNFDDSMVKLQIADPVYLLNAQELKRLLNTDHPEERLMLAELHRNLGEFDTCLELLSGITDARYTKRLGLLRKACSAKKSAVLRLD